MLRLCPSLLLPTLPYLTPLHLTPPYPYLTLSLRLCNRSGYAVVPITHLSDLIPPHLAPLHLFHILTSILPFATLQQKRTLRLCPSLLLPTLSFRLTIYHSIFATEADAVVPITVEFNPRSFSLEGLFVD